MSYVIFNPGDEVRAAALTEMQQKIKEDIRNQIEAAKKELRCPKRYFLDMEVLLAAVSGTETEPAKDQRLQPAVLTHDLGCNPMIQVYELQDLPIVYPKAYASAKWHKFCVCAPADFNDPEAIEFETKSFDEFHWGVPLDAAIRQVADDEVLQKKFKDSFTLGVWIRNLHQLLFEPGPTQTHFNMGAIHETGWVLAREDRTVGELKALGEWPPRFVYRPRLVNHLIVPEESGPSGPKKGAATKSVRIGIFHLNLSKVEIAPETDKRTGLMVLLGS